MEQGASLYFTIGSNNGTPTDIKYNQFCKWTIDLDMNKTYLFQMLRSQRFEKIDMFIEGEIQEFLPNKNFIEATRFAHVPKEYSVLKSRRITIYTQQIVNSP